MNPRARVFRWKAFDRPLPRRFYTADTARVAARLLGCFIVHRLAGGDRVARIVETEAYVRDDPASHAFLGETARSHSMFLDPGTLYVFRIHQVCCANAVTRRGEAVLIRAAEPVSPALGPTSGPGRLCRSLRIGRNFDGDSLVQSSVRLLRGPRPREETRIGPRVGVSRGREWPLRFFLDGNRFVSAARKPSQRSLAQS